MTKKMKSILGHSRRALTAALLVLALDACSSLSVTAPSVEHPLVVASSGVAEAKRLHALFDETWESWMRRFPEWATGVGDNRYGDRLHDASVENEADEFAEMRHRLRQAAAIDRTVLDAKDRTSLDLYIHNIRDALEFEPLTGWRRMSLGAIGGFHTDFASLLRDSPVARRSEAEQVLSRLAAYPRRVDQELVRLREGLSLGWVPPKPVIARVLVSLDKQIAAQGEDSPFFEPFTRLGKDIAAGEQAALRTKAKKVVDETVLPAQRSLRDFVAGEYATAAPAAGNLALYPEGTKVYAALVRQQTTTDLAPAQIHAIGLREVARLRVEIDQVMRDMSWSGDFASFAHHLNTDPQYFYPSANALLTAYRDIGKRIDAELPRYFAELPRASWGVRAMQDADGPDAAESYSAPALDGSRPGWFNANAVGYNTRPIWGLETLVAHEAVPGHHLQNARAVELGELPKFRRSAWYVAYGEGWALYAETLGFDLGLYKEPASRFGHLRMQMLRAARLVVDTGLHELNWTRQQAIDYMLAQTGIERGFIESEVDRYTSWPGQALGYMIGELKIIELRDRARAKLRERFDIRRFHMVLLDQGAVPLTVLDQLVDAWLAAELAHQ